MGYLWDIHALFREYQYLIIGFILL